MNPEFDVLVERASSQGVSFQTRIFSELDSRLRIANEKDLFGEYLASALPEEIYFIAGAELSMHPYSRILGETEEGTSPGGTIIAHGYIPFASSIGGNVACFSVSDGTIRWADHSYVSTRIYTFHPETREMEEHEITPANLSKFLPVIAGSFREFLIAEQEGSLGPTIEKLDLS